MALAATENTKIGTSVANRYRLLRVLGRGGMGIVYEAQDEVTGRHVAIKVMHPESQVSAENVRRFVNEAHTAGRVRHSNVVEVLDAGQCEQDGSLYIVLELLNGIDLATYLMRFEKLIASETLTVVLQVLQALIVAHGAQIVHRDIKPENIFLARQASGETHVKIVDFGISKVLNPEQNINLSITQSNTTVGTPHYMSPEQAKGEAIDPRADIWALGVVMYECLTGHLPFDGENFNTQIVAVVTEAHKPATDFGVEPELSALIDRCLQKDRKNRFSSATEMLEALRAYLETHPDCQVRPSLLKPPVPHELPTAKPSDPTSQLPTNDDAAAPSDTLEQMPVFPGMVRIEDDLHADSLPTTVRAIVVGGAAPVPIAERARVYQSDPPPPLAPPLPLAEGEPSGSGVVLRPTSLAAPPMPNAVPAPIEVDNSAPAIVAPSPSRESAYPSQRKWGYALAAALLAALAALGGVALSNVPARRPAAPASANVRIRFLGMRPGAQPVVGGVRYWSNEAFVRRSSASLRVRVVAEGFVPIEFDLVPERDQDVALPAMAPAPVAPAAAVAPPAPPAAVPESTIPPTTETTPPAPTPAPAVAPAAPPAPRANVTARPSARARTAPPALPTSIAPGIRPNGVGRVSIGAAQRCRASIDGDDVGFTPIYNRTVSAGSHRVRCARDGAPPSERTVTVVAGHPARVLFER